MKVTAILKGLIDSNGHQPVQIRITQGNKRTFIPAKIKVEPRFFEKGRVKKEHPKAKEYNQKLSNLIILYQAQALSGFEKKQAKTDLFTYISTTTAHLERADGTLRQYRSQVNKLKSFRPEIHLSDLNHDFFNRYKAHLKTLGNDGNTIWSSFKFLKTFVNKAMDDKLLSEDPFKKWEFPKYIDPDKQYLTRKEVQMIDKYCAAKKCPPALLEVGTWFLIGCYTGLRISDIKAFDKRKNIVSGRVVFKTQKTGEVVGLPVTPRLKKYFERVNYQPLSMHENIYNKLLKVLAGAVGIEKRLHAHLSRHTVAVMLADAGVSQEVTAKILGQKSLKATAVYYKITNQRIDSEIKKLT